VPKYKFQVDITTKEPVVISRLRKYICQELLAAQGRLEPEDSIFPNIEIVAVRNFKSNAITIEKRGGKNA
jgi:hypothetical protein